MRIKLLIAFIGLLFTLSACSNDKPMPTSTPYVEGTDIKIPVGIHVSTWQKKHDYGEGSAYEVNVHPVVIPPNSKIILSFDREPNKIEKISEVLSPNDSTLLDNSKNEIVVPYTEGTHTYAYLARWDEGYVQFVIKVEVKGK